MSRMRVLMLSLLAVLAFGAVAAATASATSYWVNGTEVKGTDVFEVEGTSGTSTLAVPGLATIVCGTDELSGTIEAEGKSKAEIKFTKCKVEGLPTCAVAEPIEVKVKDTLVMFEEKLGDAFEPSEGVTFAAIKIKGSSCTIKGTYEVKGKQQCGLDTNAETEQEEHEIICEPAGSELKFGEKEANFTGTEKVKLKSGGEWSVKRPAYWVNGTQVKGSDVFEVEGTSGTSKLAVPGLATIECETDELTGTIEAEGKSKDEIKFTKCKVPGLPACTVTEPLEIKVNDLLVVLGPKLGDAFEPSEGVTFVAIKIKGSSCTIKGTYEVKGKQQCELDANAATQQQEHEIICEPAGSELKFGEKEATFTGAEKVKLKSGGKWSAKA